jgi:hypothetical protein
MSRELEEWFEPESRASSSLIALRMSPFSVLSQIRHHGLEGAAIPETLTIA